MALALSLAFIAFVALNAARVVLTLYALELGAPASSVGVLGGMFYLFPLLLSWPIGALSDRIGPRRLLLLGAVAGTGALVLPYYVREIGAFYSAAALCGLSIAFYHVTLQNLVGVLSRPQERARNFSNFSLVGATTSFVGPLVAGFSIDHYGHAFASLVIVAISATAFVALPLGWRALPAPRATPATAAPPANLPADPGIWRMIAASALVQLGTDLFQFYVPIYGHEIGLSASAIGSVLASFAAAAFVVRIFLPRLIRQAQPNRLLMYAFYAGALGFLIVPFFHQVGWLRFRRAEDKLIANRISAPSDYSRLSKAAVFRRWHRDAQHGRLSSFAGFARFSSGRSSSVIMAAFFHGLWRHRQGADRRRSMAAL